MKISASVSLKDLTAWQEKKPIFAAYLVAFCFRFIDDWKLPLSFTVGNSVLVALVLINPTLLRITEPYLAVLLSLFLIFFVAIAAIVNFARRHTFTAVLNLGAITLNLIVILGIIHHATA